MKRIIMHWSAGTHTASKTDKKHYHFIVQGDGSIVEGNFKPEANERPVKGQYAPHTLNLNTGSIGVSVAAMHNAKEAPFSAGKYPITEKQLAAMLRLVARLSQKYDIPVQRDRVLTHAEVQPTLNVKQRAKWDINWIPGMTKPGDPVTVGDELRARISRHIQPTSTKPTPSPQGGFWAAIAAAFAALRKGKSS